jgi:hypothetical protein
MFTIAGPLHDWRMLRTRSGDIGERCGGEVR